MVRVSRHPRPSVRHRWARPPALALPAVLVLGGCSATVGVSPAVHADDPACASVLLALPESLGEGLERVQTSSQGTAAWGTAQQAVVLRCGVEPPGPTIEQCVTMETASGASVDWLVSAGSDGADGASDGAATTGSPSTDPSATPDPVLDPGGSDWTFLTYGRDPAVEVVVPAGVVAERSTAFLDALVPAISAVPAERTCL